jgi:hypothetical protein
MCTEFPLLRISNCQAELPHASPLNLPVRANCQRSDGPGSPQLDPLRRANCHPRDGPRTARRLHKRATCRPQPGNGDPRMATAQRPHVVMARYEPLHTWTVGLRILRFETCLLSADGWQRRAKYNTE